MGAGKMKPRARVPTGSEGVGFEGADECAEAPGFT